MMEKLEELITQKIVCTYIPIASEINILPSLTSLAKLNTTFIEDEILNICEYKEPFIKNQFGVLEPKYKKYSTKC